MAEIKYLLTQKGENINLVTWAGLGQGDTGQALELPNYSDKTMQSVGDYSGSASVSMRGSNEGATYSVLNDGAGNALTNTADAVKTVLENPRFIKPTIASGDGSTSITVTLLIRKERM